VQAHPRPLVISCLNFFKQDLVGPAHQINRDHERVQNFSSKVRQKNFKQSLVETRSSRGCSTFFKQGLLKKPEHVSTDGEHISVRFIQIWLPFFKQGLHESRSSRVRSHFFEQGLVDPD